MGDSAGLTAFENTDGTGVPTGGQSVATPTKQDGALPTVPATGGKFMETPTTEPSSNPLTGGAAQFAVSQPDNQTTASDTASTKAVKDFPATTEQVPAQPTESAPNSQSNTLDKDAALAGGAGMAAAGTDKALKKNRYDFDDPSPYSSRTLDPRVDSITRKMPGAWPRGESYQSEVAAPTTTTSTEPETNVRDFGDTAAAAGSVGAAGLGAHELEKDHIIQESLADVNAVAGSKTMEPTQSELDQPAHHYGRDAAIVGGLGAAGLGVHEAERHMKKEESVSETTDPALSTVNPEQHISTVDNRPPQINEPEHHYGRDAVVAGGAGATGFGAYETYNHHEQSKAVADPSATAADPAAVPSNEPASIAGKAPMNSQSTAAQPEPQHHFGRDTAIAGGAEATAYEADKYFNHPDNTTVDGQHLAIEHEPSQTLPDDDESTYSQTDAAPFIAHNLPETAEPQHHYGRDAAIAGGAGAAAWFADDEIEKKHKQKDSMDPHLDSTAHILPRYDDQTAEMHDHSHDKHPGFASGGETLPAAKELGSKSTAADPESQQHHGHDAALASGLGVAGAGAYAAHSAHSQPQPADADAEYVKQQQQDEPAPQRSGTHSRKSSKEERKHGSVLGKLFQRRSRAGTRDGSASPPSATVEDDTADSAAAAPPSAPGAPGATGAAGPTGVADASVAADDTAHTPDQQDFAPEPATPTRGTTEKRSSPKQHAAELAHLGPNKLHKAPTKRYLRKHAAAAAAAASGGESPPSGAEGARYGEGLEDGAYRGVEQQGEGGFRGNAWDEAEAGGSGNERREWVGGKENDALRTR